MSKPEFVYVIYIQAPKQKVWDAITTGEHTKYFWKRFVRSEWKQGARVEFMYPDDQTKLSHDGEIIEIDAPNRLVMTFDLKPEGFDEPASRVTYELDEHETGTKFTVIHENFPPDSKVLPGISNGWPRILSNMKTYIESGKLG